MSRESSASDTAPDPRLDDRVMELLAAHAGRLAFNGLRRTLGAHPESLSRALRRLERDGLVVREEGSYMLRSDQPPPARSGPTSERNSRTVASISLPPGLSAQDVLGALAGRWFGRLRWVGVYENTEDPWLVWSVGDSARHVLLSVRRGTLRVLVDLPRSDPGAVELEEAAQDLLVQGLTRLRRNDRAVSSSVLTFALGRSIAVEGDN